MMNKWVASLISLALAVIFGIACFFMPEKVDLFWTIVVSILTFLISFVFVELTDHIKKIEKNDINSNYKFFKDSGISEYQSDFSKLDFTSCISGATHIKLVLLYSSNFIVKYIDSLRRFVERDGSTFEIILLTNNKDTNSFKYVSDKFGYGEDKLFEKINDFVKLLRDDLLPYKSSKSSIKLSFTNYIPAYTLYMFDEYAYITLYKTAPQRTTVVPCFRIERAYDSSFFNFLINDFNDIKKDSESQNLGQDV